MKKKRPQQQATPPTKELKILAVKRSPKPVEPPQEQPAAVLTEQPVVDAASAQKPVEPTSVNEPAHASSASSASSSEPDARCSSPKSAPEPVPDPTASSPERREQGEKTSSNSPDSPALPSEQQALFQAVGVIKGDITLSEDKTWVTIGKKQYELYYAGNHKRAYEALKKEIDNTGITQQKLIVYPKITHYPGGKQPYRLGFQLAGFVGHEATGEGITSELEDLEFKICGLWQFIPVCRVPCISVFKNFNKQRLEYIKSAPVDKKVNFMKASHIPVMWRDAPVPPFRFNPKLDKEAQGKASFVQIKARFNSARDNFEFVSLLGMPREEPPNYLKAGKKDKTEAVKAKRAALKGKERSSLPVPENDAAPTPSDSASKPKPKPKPKVVAAQQ